MSPSSISYNSDFAIDLSRIKCIKIIPLPEEEYALLFQLNGRTIYSQHPQTAVWEKEIIHEEVIKEYDSYDMAKMYFTEWVNN